MPAMHDVATANFCAASLGEGPSYRPVSRPAITGSGIGTEL